MSLKIMDAGSVLRTITSMKVKDGGALRRILRMKVMDADGTTLRTVASFIQPLSGVTISPSPAWTDHLEPTGTPSIVIAFTTPVTASPVNGLGPYSYSWTRLSGTGTASSPTVATTNFYEAVATGGEEVGQFRCTVTDSLGATAFADVTANFTG